MRAASDRHCQCSKFPHIIFFLFRKIRDNKNRKMSLTNILITIVILLIVIVFGYILMTEDVAEYQEKFEFILTGISILVNSLTLAYIVYTLQSDADDHAGGKNAEYTKPLGQAL